MVAASLKHVTDTGYSNPELSAHQNITVKGSVKTLHLFVLASQMNATEHNTTESKAADGVRTK